MKIEENALLKAWLAGKKAKPSAATADSLSSVSALLSVLETSLWKQYLSAKWLAVLAFGGSPTAVWPLSGQLSTAGLSSMAAVSVRSLYQRPSAQLAAAWQTGAQRYHQQLAAQRSLQQHGEAAGGLAFSLRRLAAG